ncbi:MAG TPA: hypothetical protein VNX25_03720, partial [Verrucomicrobiae bacterium]|nr:hypothetical protein [Verrucomicrobiae bacterium]
MRRLIALSLVLALTCGCVHSAPVVAPLPCTLYEGDRRTLLVLLPGRGEGGEGFLHHGIIDLLREKGVTATLAAPEAHLGYYMEGSALLRLREDV